ncbi:MAG: hypothetical protein IT169_04595 [Bryobacterales bacterium]|nr:hypothetical protein [Bryobacterales bacterium]
MVSRLFVVIFSIVCISELPLGLGAESLASNRSDELSQRAWQVIENTWSKEDGLVRFTLVSEPKIPVGKS